MFEGRNVHYSTDNKPLCSFSGKLCKLRRLNGYAFCVRHILEDPSAPYRQCSYVVKSSGQKCSSAIPVSQDREYCHSHMQVMGIIPKKERRKKTDITLPSHDIDGSITDKNHILHNSLYSLHEKPTKLFPELAGKLSADNLHPGAASFVNGMEVPSDTVKGKSPSKLTGLTPRRQKKSTRRVMAVIRKKQLGLVSDANARSMFSPTGYQTYSQYVSNRTYHADLLTPIVDSSDEDEETDNRLFYPPLTYSRMLRNSNLSHHPIPPYQSPHQHQTDSYQPLPPSSHSSVSPLTLPSPDTDLKHSQQSSGTEESISSGNESIPSDEESISDSEEKVADADLVCLMKSYVDLMWSARLNGDSINYHRSYLSNLLSLLKQSSVVATKLVRVVRVPSYRHQHTEQSATPKPEAAPPAVIPRANRKQVCRYVDTKTEKRCANPTVPFANHCLQHITYNVSQQLFSSCTAYEEDDDETGNVPCKLPVVDVRHGPPLCSLHAPPAFSPDDTLEASSESSRKSRKRAKSFALLKHPKKKKKKTGKLPKPDTSNTAGNDPFPNACLTSPVANGRSTPSAVAGKAEEAVGLVAEDGEISPLDKSLELPLDHADSKLLLEEFNIFSGDGDDDIGLTDADAQMILSAETDASPVLNESCELPDDITDAILHVESEQKARESQQSQSQQNSGLQAAHRGLHDPAATQNHMIPANGPIISSSANFELNHNLSHSLPAYSLENSLNNGMQVYNHHHHQAPPPPQYPGPTKMMQHSPVANNMPTPHMPPHMNYMHGHPHSQQPQPANTPYNHHPQLHQKLQPPQQQHSPSTVSQHNHIIMSNPQPAPPAATGYHMPTLPPSSTLLDPSRHQSAPAAHMDRLPPVSSIAIQQQQQWGVEEGSGMYNNGYHGAINDPGLFNIPNGLPSPPPPQYPTGRDHIAGYHHYSQPYHSNPYNLIPPPPQPQRLNMPLQ